jgi:hypothetical protein
MQGGSEMRAASKELFIVAKRLFGMAGAVIQIVIAIMM